MAPIRFHIVTNTFPNDSHRVTMLKLGVPMPDAPQSFGDRVRELRGSRLTQAELADRSDLAPAALSRLLNGERTPRMEHLLAIASALNVTLVELTGGTDAAEAVAEWIPRADYEESEARRIEAEEALAAQAASVTAAEAEVRALKAEFTRLHSTVGALQQAVAEARAAVVGERAAREAASHAAAASAARAQRLEWALGQAQKRVSALQADLERSGKAQVATGFVAAALGALLVAGAADEGPRRRRR